MILLLNGSFGIGKTSVARALVAQLPGAMLFDPEFIGIPLQHGARLLGRPVGDFQDLRLWRTLTVRALRQARRLREAIIVPMAFSNTDYLAEIRGGAGRFDADVRHFCLIAPEAVVHERLRRRGADPIAHAWQFRRASECCAVHGDPEFAVHVDATDRLPEALAAGILEHIGR